LLLLLLMAVMMVLQQLSQLLLMWQLPGVCLQLLVRLLWSQQAGCYCCLLQPQGWH
jgi:hypothetical protein